MNLSLLSILWSKEFSSRRMKGEIEDYFGSQCWNSGARFSLASDSIEALKQQQ